MNDKKHPEQKQMLSPTPNQNTVRSDGFELLTFLEQDSLENPKAH